MRPDTPRRELCQTPLTRAVAAERVLVMMQEQLEATVDPGESKNQTGAQRWSSRPTRPTRPSGDSAGPPGARPRAAPHTTLLHDRPIASELGGSSLCPSVPQSGDTQMTSRPDSDATDLPRLVRPPRDIRGQKGAERLGGGRIARATRVRYPSWARALLKASNERGGDTDWRRIYAGIRLDDAGG